MHKLNRYLISTVLLLSMSPVLATTIADSIAEFSSVQGGSGWSYGYFVAGTDPMNLTPFTSGGFSEFDTFNAVAMAWEASDAQVGAANNDFLSLDATGGHPTGIGPGPQTTIIWAVRRYVSSADELVQLKFDVRKDNVGNPGGGGITARVFIDGIETYSELINNDDGVGTQLGLLLDLDVGTVIDLAIDPSGVAPLAGSDGIYSARADGSHFSATLVSAVPLPPALPLVAVALFGLRRARRRSSPFSQLAA